jgi:2-polyprenyl-3-methyl-5-hydroxy-6-metoxy-1,4-benzoquinol methylase
MKTRLFPVTSSGTYRLESFSQQEAEKFVQQRACPACGEQATLEPIVMMGGSSADKSLKLVYCRACGHVTYDRLPTEAWLEHYYSEVWDQASRKVPASMVRLKPGYDPPWGPWDHFGDLELPTDSHILDFGCGYGSGLLYLKSKGYRNIYGVEMGSHRADVANRHFPGRVRHGAIGEARKIVEESGPFDAVALHHVAEHLRDPFQMVSDLITLLKPGGMIVIAVPEIYAESPLHLPLYFPHLHHFNTTSMMRMLRRAGLAPYRWTRSRPQLAVIGSRDAQYKPPPAYTAEEPEVTEEFLKGIAQFISAPWRKTESAEEVYITYFHPWMSPQHPRGFQQLDERAASWLNLGRYTIFPLLNLERRIGIDRRKVIYRAFFKSARRFLGQGAIIGNEVIGYRPLEQTENDVPWLTLENGDIPVIVK